MLLLKSHVKEHTRINASGKVSTVKEYDDSRSKKAREKVGKGAGIPTQLTDLPAALREKCQRAEPGKGGAITLLKAESAILLHKGVFGLISAGRNPNIAEDKALDDEAVNIRGEHLKQDLVDKGLKFVKVLGKYGEEEESYMVLTPDITRDELMELGEKYNQDSVIFSDRNKNELIYTTGEHKGEKNVGNGFDYLPKDAGDFFTEITTAKTKLKFTLHFDFDTFVKSLRSAYMYLLRKAHIRTHERHLASGKVVTVHEHDDKRILHDRRGAFRHAETGRYFEYQPTSDQWFKEQGATHEIDVRDPHGHGKRGAIIKKTVAHVIIDEDHEGKAVWEKWPLKDHRVWAETHDAVDRHVHERYGIDTDAHARKLWDETGRKVPFEEFKRNLFKAHISAYSRKTASGKVSMVREHEDRRKPSEEAKHFQEETHQQKGGGMRLGKLSLDEIVTIVKRGLETVGMKAAAGDVNKGNVKRYMEWVIHEFSKQGVTYDVRTREAHVNEKLKAKANHIIGLFQQAQKQLHAMG